MLFRFLPRNISETVMYTGFQSELEAGSPQFPTLPSQFCHLERRLCFANPKHNRSRKIPSVTTRSLPSQGVSITVRRSHSHKPKSRRHSARGLLYASCNLPNQRDSSRHGDRVRVVNQESICARHLNIDQMTVIQIHNVGSRNAAKP